MKLLRLVRRTAVTVLVLLIGVVPFLATDGAQADEIDDVRSRAAEVSAKISDLNGRIAAATSEVEIANSKAARLDVRIADASKRLDAAKKQEGRTRRQLADFAIRAYTSGGAATVDLSTLMHSDGDEIGSRKGYQSTVVGDRQQLVDELQAARKVTEQHATTLREAKQKADAVAEQANAKRSEAEAAQDELRSIKTNLDGELAELVAEKQEAERRAAEAEARAAAQRAEDRAAAAAQAEASAAAETTSSSAPSSPSPAPAPGPTRPVPAPTRPAPVSPPPPATAPSNPGSAAGAAIAAARSQLGVPYLWGGTSPSTGFDCSGLTQWAYRQAGVSLPRTTYGQRNAGRIVSVSQIQPGDLVFYLDYGHMGMYIGGGQLIHAPQTGDVVKISSLYMYPPIRIVRPTG